MHWWGSQPPKDHLHIFRSRQRPVSPCHKYHYSTCIIAINACRTERWGGEGWVGTKSIGNNQAARISPWQAMNASCAVRVRDRTILANKRSYITPLEIGLSFSSTSSSWTKMGKTSIAIFDLITTDPRELAIRRARFGYRGVSRDRLTYTIVFGHRINSIPR